MTDRKFFAKLRSEAIKMTEQISIMLDSEDKKNFEEFFHNPSQIPSDNLHMKKNPLGGTLELQDTCSGVVW